MPVTSNETLVKLIQDNIDISLNYEKLYFQNTGFIYQTVKKYINEKNTLEDLMQQSFIGLANAVRLYDETKSENFLNILKYCLMNSIRELNTDIPEYMNRNIIKYKSVLQCYKKLYSKMPTDNQIMKEMDISKEQLTYIKQLSRTCLSLDELIDSEGETTRLDLLVDENTDGIYEMVEKEEMKKTVYESIDLLPGPLKEVIDKKYFYEQTLKGISEEMNASYDYVKRLRDKALSKLRRNKKLKEMYLDYSSINEYLNVGSDRFNTTWTSSTEKLVLLREKLRKEYKQFDKSS